MSPSSTQPGANLPDLVVLDVNETLSDLSPMNDAFAAVGLDPDGVDAWFAGVLRDAFALTVMAGNPSFADIGAASLRVRLTAAGSSDPEAEAQQVMARFTGLEPHPDVVPGLCSLAEAGCRIVTLSNGSADVARKLLQDTEAGPRIEQYLSVSDAGAWKPHPRAYRHALTATSVPPEKAMLVAVHPWDIAGARRAGLRTAWINRGATTYPDHFVRPEIEARSMAELAELYRL